MKSAPLALPRIPEAPQNPQYPQLPQTRRSRREAPLVEKRAYDLIVLGSGPAGEKGGAQAAYFGKKVALVEREPHLGGAAANTGTLPSKTLRGTALYLS